MGEINEQSLFRDIKYFKNICLVQMMNEFLNESTITIYMKNQQVNGQHIIAIPHKNDLYFYRMIIL
jgi:hypothetical protein